MSFFENTRRPEGFGGKLMVSMMNLGHDALAEWGLQFVALGRTARALRPGGRFFFCNECGGDNPKDAKWTECIDGMTIYTAAQLQALLEQAGFADVQPHKHPKGWLCMTAQKL